MIPVLVLGLLLALVLPSSGPSNAALQAMADARQRVQVGEAKEALEALKAAGVVAPMEELPESAGILAAALAGTGNVPGAVELYRALLKAPALPPLARVVLDLRVLELCASGCSAPSWDAAVVTGLPPILRARALQALARTAPGQAAALAREEVKSASITTGLPEERAALLLAIHAALTAGGDAAGAHGAAVLAWETLPGDPALVPLLAPLDNAAVTREVGPARAIKHLEALSEANRNEEVTTYARLLCGGELVEGKRVCAGQTEPAVACNVAFLGGKALRQGRLNAQAESVLETVIQACPDLAPRALYLQGKAMAAQTGGAPRAILAYQKIVKGWPEHKLADDALVLSGQLEARGGGKVAARLSWQRVVDQYKTGDQAEDAAWWLAWDDHLSGNDVAATARLETLASNPATSFLAWKRAAYWHARLHKDPKKTEQGMRQLLDRAPQSWEAGLARGWLARKGLKVPPSGVVAGSMDGIVEPANLDDALKAAVFLARVGVDAEAALLFRASPRLAPADDRADVWIARQLLLVGDAPTASRYMRGKRASLFSGPLLEKDAAFWRVAYPLAHAAAIHTAAKDVKLPPLLLSALAREESAFDARIVSWAGAVGLTQLMPATAAMEAKALKLPEPDIPTLVDPVLNAKLGGAHLARDLRTFHGNAALALAAYNAGPGSVKTWMGRNGGEDLDAFVERIPIDETRGYVKRVLETYSTYLLLSGQPPLTLPKRPQDGFISGF